MTDLERAILKCNAALAKIGVPPLHCPTQSWLQKQDATPCKGCEQLHRHAINCPVVFHEPDYKWWDDWVMVMNMRHASDPKLLAGAPRPMHEEWSDKEGCRYIADGTGKFYSLGVGVIEQQDATGFWREEPRRQAERQELLALYERARKQGRDTEWVDAKLESVRGPFSACSWYAIGQVSGLLVEHVKLSKREERLAQQAVVFQAQASKRSKKLSSFRISRSNRLD
jgi:hypothetical protein